MLSEGTQPDMTSITACFWLKMARSDLSAHYVSYVVSGGSFNEFAMWGVTHLILDVQDDFRYALNLIH